MHDRFKWVQNLLKVEVTDDRRIVATTLETFGRHSRRPSSLEEAFAELSSDVAEEQMNLYPLLRDRVPGKYRYYGFMGGAVAMLVESDRLRRLSEPLMAKLADWYGGPWGDLTYLAEVRTTGANSIRNCAEPAGGMAGDFDLAAEMLGESVELGFYSDYGWVGFVLPEAQAAYQNKLDEEQEHWWNVVMPGLRKNHNAMLEFLDIGSDELDGRRGIVSPGHVGEFSLVAWAKLHLPGHDWRVLDTESRPGREGEPEWVALNRTIVGITTRGKGKAPIAYVMHPDGGVHESALHVILEGENLDRALSHLSLPALRALGWLPPV